MELDAFGQQALEEAMQEAGLDLRAKRTPAVAFNTGSMVDAVQHMQTGYL